MIPTQHLDPKRTTACYKGETARTRVTTHHPRVVCATLVNALSVGRSVCAPEDEYHGASKTHRVLAPTETRTHLPYTLNPKS